jgi:hypothetical protein
MAQITVFCLNPVTTAFLHASFDLKIVNALHQNMVYAASVNADLVCLLAEIFIFSLMLSQVLFMSMLSFKFSKATNLSEILI